MPSRSGTRHLVHHSDRGVQYASCEYVQLLHQHQMIQSMSRPANPYNNASCESFLKTMKREEIYANRYRDLGHLRRNMEVFIEQYSNRLKLHSALAIVRQKSLSRRWCPAIHTGPRPCSFFNQPRTLNPREPRV